VLVEPFGQSFKFGSLKSAMMPLFKSLARNLKNELTASTAALVNRLIARNPNMTPAATSRIVVLNMATPPHGLNPPNF
jgi:hypothetical protein